jgi:hypothetical protein
VEHGIAVVGVIIEHEEKHAQTVVETGTGHQAGECGASQR